MSNIELSHTNSVSDLLVHVGQGDRLAMEKLLRKYRPYLRVVAQRATRKMFSPKFDTSDIVQQACLEAYNGMPHFRGRSEAEFNGWITTILNRNMINLIRNHTAQRRDVRREFSLGHGGPEISLQWHEADTGTGPASRLLKGEAALILAEALTRLTDSQRTAIQMRFLEGMKFADIADQMDIQPSSVARLIARGIENLRKHLPVEIQQLR